MSDVYTSSCYVFGQLSSVKRWLKEPMLFLNICGDASMFRYLVQTGVRTRKNMPCVQMMHT